MSPEAWIAMVGGIAAFVIAIVAGCFRLASALGALKQSVNAMSRNMDELFSRCNRRGEKLAKLENTVEDHERRICRFED